MKKYDKVLFVCRSNTILSPMAEAILQDRFMLEDVLIESKGLIVLFPEPVNPKAEAILASHKLTMKDHTSRQFGKDDFDARTPILTMDKKDKEDILSEYGEEAINVYALTEYIDSDEQLPDPYGGALSDYGQCFEQLEVLVDRLAEKIKEEDALYV